MTAKEKKLRRFFIIFTIPAIIGVFFCLKYYGWLFVKIGAIVSAFLPGFLWGMTKAPEQNAPLYTYRKDNSKLFGYGKLLNQEPMVGKKRLSEVNKENDKYIKKMGGEKKVFIDLFLIPYFACLIIFFTLAGWITFFKKIF